MNSRLRDVMPVVVLFGPNGLWAMDLRTNEDRYIARFPEDLETFVNALARTYARGMPTWWVRAKLKQLLEYLEVRDGYILDGDLIRVENGRIWGVKSMPELVKDLTRIYGKDIELFLLLLFDLGVGLRKELKEVVG